MTIRRAAGAIAALACLWIIGLLVLGAAYAGRYGDNVAERVGDSLGGSGAIGATELSLVSGRIELDKLSVQRDDEIGKLSLEMDSVRCDVAPLGWVFVDSTCDELVVRGVRLEASTAAVFHVHNPRRAPIHASHVVIDDAELAFAPSAFLPRLGRIAIHIDHAEAGDTVFRTPLSWLLSLEVLKMRIELPARLVVRLSYEGGVLSAEGSLFGKTPVSLPIHLPVAQTFEDGRAEIRALVHLGEDVAEKLVSKRAEDWIRSKLH